MELVDGPWCDIDDSSAITEVENGEDGGKEGAADEVRAPQLVGVGRFDAR